jgi:hypothetical protein
VLGSKQFRMGDRSRRLLKCAQVRKKLYRKDSCWSVWLVYDSKELPGVMTVRPEVAGVLQWVSNLTLVVS